MKSVFFASLILVVLSLPAISAPPKSINGLPAVDMQEMLRMRLDKAKGYYREAKQQLESVPDGASFEELKVPLEKYLHAANYVVYVAKINANHDGSASATNSNLKALVGKYLTEWPGNPLNAWEPMKVLSSGDPYSAGDLVYLLAGSDHTSTEDNEIAVRTFAVFVYGPLQLKEQFGKFVLTDHFREWGGTIPQGALYGRDSWVQSDREVEEAKKKLEQWLKDNPEEAARIKAAQDS